MIRLFDGESLFVSSVPVSSVDETLFGESAASVSESDISVSSEFGSESIVSSESLISSATYGFMDKPFDDYSGTEGFAMLAFSFLVLSAICVVFYKAGRGFKSARVD